MPDAPITKANGASWRKDLLAKEPPSILKQTPWECGIYKFPDENPQREYFNCSIANWRGGKWLVTRKNEVKPMIGFRNGITLWLLEGNKPTLKRDIQFQKIYPGEQHEDPRAIVRDGHLLISYCNFMQGRSYAHQCLAEVTPDCKVNRPFHPKYGKNGKSLFENEWNEKNWCWFVHEGFLHFVYMTNPTVICKTRMGQVVEEYKTESKINWPWGELRGGTPPVRVGDEYISFFHSSTQWRTQRERRYFMGAIAFSATAPFKITRYTPNPLLIGSPDDVCKSNGPVCVFPCGALFENGEWHVVGGLNDLRCFWLKIPHADLLKRMKKC